MENNPLVAYARQAAERAGVNPAIFFRQIMQESGFNPSAGSHAGAQGIAQIMPQYHPGVDPWNPYESLDYAANLMASHLRNYNGDYSLALAAYNAGPGAVQQYGGVPPFDETQHYVATILGSSAPPPSGGDPGLSMLPATSTAGGDYSLGGIEEPGRPFDFPAWLRERAPLPGRGPLSGWLPFDWMSAPFGGGGGTAAAAVPTTGEVQGPPNPTPADDPYGNPNDWRVAASIFMQAGKIPPFSDQVSYDAWRAAQAASGSLDDEYKRAQIAAMQRNAQQSGADNAWRMEQLRQQALDRAAKLRVGPENWLQYWSESRGEPLDPAADQRPINEFPVTPPPPVPPVVPPAVPPTLPATATADGGPLVRGRKGRVPEGGPAWIGGRP